MEVAGQGRQRLHDALHVHHHRLHRAGEDRQLLVQEVARRRDALAHQRLVGGAADARHVEAGRTLAPGVGDQFGVVDRSHQHLRQRRFVAVDDDVDLVVLEHAQVDLRNQRAGRAEKNVRQIGGDHGAAPAVGEGAAHGLVEDVLGVLVVAHVGAVEHLHHLAVDAPRRDLQLLPQLVTLRRRPLEKGQFALLLAELGDGLVGHVDGNVVERAAFGGDAVVPGHRLQFVGVANLEAFRFALGRRLEGEGQVATVVRMGGAARGHMPRKDARADGLQRSAADAHLTVFGDAARPHQTHGAAHAPAADGAGGHLVGAAECRADAQRLRPLQQRNCGRVGAGLLGSSGFFCHVSS